MLEKEIFEVGVSAVMEQKLALAAFCGAQSTEEIDAAEVAMNDARRRCLDFELMLPTQDYASIKEEARERLKWLFEADSDQGAGNHE